jgi:hypothetical protein
MTSLNFKPVSIDGRTKYEYENRIFSQYVTRYGTKYLRCVVCKSTAVIRDGTFTLIKAHTCHDVEDIGSSDSHADHEVDSYNDSDVDSYADGVDGENEEDMKDNDEKVTKR